MEILEIKMNSDFRKTTRIYPKDFVDYSVTLNYNGTIYKGFLGNISENGLCAIMPSEFQPNANAIIDGSIIYNPLKDELKITGRLAWKTNYEFQKKNTVMIGMEFTSKIKFPEYLIALSMSFEN